MIFPCPPDRQLGSGGHRNEALNWNAVGQALKSALHGEAERRS